MRLKFLGIFLVSLLAFVLFSGGLSGGSVAEGVYLPLPGVSEYVYSASSATKGLTNLSAINKNVAINFGKENLLLNNSTPSNTGIGVFVRGTNELPTNKAGALATDWNGSFSQSRTTASPIDYTEYVDHSNDWIVKPLSPVYTIVPVDNFSSYDVDSSKGAWVSAYSIVSPSTITLKYDANMSDSYDTISVLYRVYDSAAWEIMPSVVNSSSKTVTATFIKNGFGSYSVVNLDSYFTDFSSVSWSQQYVSSLWTKGVMSQTGSNGSFGLVDVSKNEYKTTRGEFASMLVKGMRLPVQGWNADIFSDLAPPLQGINDTPIVNYDYYYPNWRNYAYISGKYGIFSGIRDSITGKLDFQPNEYITREQAAALIVRVSKLKVENLDLADATFASTTDPKTGKKTYKGKICKALSNYTDLESISPWALPYVLAVTKAKYMEGFTDSTFRPNGATGQITRAQSAVIIYKLLKNRKQI